MTGRISPGSSKLVYPFPSTTEQSRSDLIHSITHKPTVLCLPPDVSRGSYRRYQRDRNAAVQWHVRREREPNNSPTQSGISSPLARLHYRSTTDILQTGERSPARSCSGWSWDHFSQLGINKQLTLDTTTGVVQVHTTTTGTILTFLRKPSPHGIPRLPQILGSPANSIEADRSSRLREGACFGWSLGLNLNLS